MKERPIIMKAESVRAIFAEAKTQTRRPVKLPHGPAFERGNLAAAWSDDALMGVPGGGGLHVANRMSAASGMPRMTSRPGPTRRRPSTPWRLA